MSAKPESLDTIISLDQPQTLIEALRSPPSELTPPVSSRPHAANHTARISATYQLSEKFKQYIDDLEMFRPVIQERMAKLQDTLANVNQSERRQAIGDIVYLRCILEGKSKEEARKVAQTSWDEAS